MFTTPARQDGRRALKPRAEALEGRQMLSAIDTVNSSWRLVSNTRYANELIGLNDPEAAQTDYIDKFSQGQDLQSLQAVQQGYALVDSVAGSAWETMLSDVQQARPLDAQAATVLIQAHNTQGPQATPLYQKAADLLAQAGPLVQTAIADWYVVQKDVLLSNVDNPTPTPDPTPTAPPPSESSPPAPPGNPGSPTDGPITIAQSPPGQGTPQNPFQLGASETFTPGQTTTLQSGTQVEVDTGGGAPQEAGVDWDTWYKNWINQVDQNVFQKMEANFAKVQDQVTVTVRYKVSRDGRVQFLGSTSSGQTPPGSSPRFLKANIQNWALSGHNGLVSQQAPLPSNTKLPFVERTFTFGWKTNGPPVKLGGPPREPAIPHKGVRA